MRGANRFVGKRTVNEHLGFALDQCLDLGLPLLRPDESGRCQHRQNLFRTARASKQLIEWAVGRNAFATFARKNNRAPLLDNTRGGAHAFDTLVQI